MNTLERTLARGDQDILKRSALTCGRSDDAARIADYTRMAIRAFREDVLKSIQDEKKFGSAAHRKNVDQNTLKIERIKKEHHVTSQELLRLADEALKDYSQNYPTEGRYTYVSQNTASERSKLDLLLVICLILLLLLSLLCAIRYIEATHINNRRQILKDKYQFSEIIIPQNERNVLDDALRRK
ncbi:MAG: hypothetical protein IJ165_03395 [Proteobacteria bacterium]|nr:hypothetical protein [Pseudomonadota bacterium]